MKVWVRPSIGLWFGVGQAGKDQEKSSVNGGFVLGDWLVKFGLLFGLNVGFGEKYGIFTGLLGAIALVPLWGFGFIGVPIGFHFKKKFGIGIVIPVWNVDPLTSTVIGILLFVTGLLIARATKEKIIA